jgi:hypothetical protein
MVTLTRPCEDPSVTPKRYPRAIRDPRSSHTIPMATAQSAHHESASSSAVVSTRPTQPELKLCSLTVCRYKVRHLVHILGDQLKLAMPARTAINVSWSRCMVSGRLPRITRMRSMQIIAVNPAVHAKAEEPLMGPRVMLLVAATAWCLTWGAGASARPLFEFRPGDDPSALRRDESWVANRVAAWQPTAEESAFDRIGFHLIITPSASGAHPDSSQTAAMARSISSMVL